MYADTSEIITGHHNCILLYVVDSGYLEVKVHPKLLIYQSNLL